ncbi:MAG: RNA polymerase sigma factor [Lachnospiraceae bacterium]|nr:RNA polymerase sigma factor [Lachnospiraceae bacterium]
MMKQEELENYIYTYGKDLYSFCCHVTHSRQEADDLYQDTFLKMYEIGEKVVIRTNPKSFLMSVALNLYRNHKRKLSVRQRIIGVSVAVDEAADSVADEEQGTENLVVAKEECLLVREMVRKLPDKYRIPILLYYMEELSIAEIAALLQMSENTAKTRMRRAKEILKERLEGQL